MMPTFRWRYSIPIVGPASRSLIAGRVRIGSVHRDLAEDHWTGQLMMSDTTVRAGTPEKAMEALTDLATRWFASALEQP